MTATRVDYSTATPIGAELAAAVDKLAEGWTDFLRVWNAVTTATDAGSDTDALIGGDFGAANSDAAARYYGRCYDLWALLAAADTGGLSLVLGSMDHGEQ